MSGAVYLPLSNCQPQCLVSLTAQLLLAPKGRSFLRKLGMSYHENLGDRNTHEPDFVLVKRIPIEYCSGNKLQASWKTVLPPRGDVYPGMEDVGSCPFEP